MNKGIKTRNITLTQAMRRHFYKRLEMTLGRYADCIRYVDTRLMGMEGEANETSILLRMVIMPKSGATLYLDLQDKDFDKLVEACCEKIQEALGVFFILDLKTEEISSSMPYVA